MGPGQQIGALKDEQKKRRPARNVSGEASAFCKSYIMGLANLFTEA